MWAHERGWVPSLRPALWPSASENGCNLSTQMDTPLNQVSHDRGENVWGFVSG